MYLINHIDPRDDPPRCYNCGSLWKMPPFVVVGDKNPNHKIHLHRKICSDCIPIILSKERHHDDHECIECGKISMDWVFVGDQSSDRWIRENATVALCDECLARIENLISCSEEKTA
jgi:hypothetical protein